MAIQSRTQESVWSLPLNREVIEHQHFLFDLDGTLIDSSALHARAYQAVIDREVPQHSEAFDYDKVTGKTTLEVFTQMVDGDSDLGRELTTQKQALYRQLVNDGELEAMPGALELLELLKNLQKGVQLVTSSSRKSVEVALKSTKLDQFLDQLVTADDVKHGKPAPDCYQLAMRNVNASSEKCIVFEDALAGIRSAQAAGLAVVGVFNPDIKTVTNYWFEDLLTLKSQIQNTMSVRP